MATFINGRAYKQNELLDSGKYKVLRVGNFYTNDSWYYSNLELADKYYIDKGDLVYTWSATFGPHIWDGEKVIYHYHIWKIELSKFLDRDFTLQILEADKAKLLANTNGSTMIHVTKKDMESKVISLPIIEEQKQIGLYLTKFDTLIALYERKTKLIKQIQSSFLDKFFSEPNNVTSLNHFLRIRNGYAFRSSELTENGEIPVVKISNIGNDKSFAFTTKEKNKEQFALYPNDIVIALSGATAGKINQISNKYPLYYQNQRVGFFERKNDKLDYEYLNSFLHSKKFKSQLQKTLVAGAQPNIAPKDIEKIKIPFIEYKLQQKIGQVNKYLFELQKIDKSKLTLLDKIKKTLLNNMFV